MSEKKEKEKSCLAVASECCRLEALVTVDERGQIVLPKDVRESAGIRAGDKLAVVTSKKEEKLCCIMLMRVEELAESIKKALEPLIQELVK
jgi:AbrB family looped-hinge helix DNA binding protein